MSEWILNLFVAGRPAPQGSKTPTGNGGMRESSKAVGDWRSVVAWTAANEYAGAPAAGPLVLAVEFVLPRPKRLSVRKPTPPHTSKPDVDKLLRAIGDAMTGVVWVDDSHIVEKHGSKRYAEPDERPGAHILVGSQHGTSPQTAQDGADTPDGSFPPADEGSPAEDSAPPQESPIPA